ncbi:MAG: hypothetical protein RIA09_04395 [Hoeflea sp.]|uniref:hypothetical protein n=1 Tax=Hoeflea sp. TaxID=1940281 RepID=UPI0032ED2DD7
MTIKHFDCFKNRGLRTGHGFLFAARVQSLLNPGPANEVGWHPGPPDGRAWPKV